jgi:hypothetical protein
MCYSSPDLPPSCLCGHLTGSNTLAAQADEGLSAR